MIAADRLQKMLIEAFRVSRVPAVLFDARDPDPGGYLHQRAARTGGKAAALLKVCLFMACK
ncbi:hypothetical protein [Ralstonia mannitolilytica]|uniref:hypothetical protein n=1 Tax=Ralstonia mannitolilytica TaxID=105219 RepID=UPI00292E32F1|nr:hypothetical protein [Ralstonia mannitolilytica]